MTSRRHCIVLEVLRMAMTLRSNPGVEKLVTGEWEWKDQKCKKARDRLQAPRENAWRNPENPAVRKGTYQLCQPSGHGIRDSHAVARSDR